MATTEPEKRAGNQPGNRRQGRILALQTLYACEVGTCPNEWRVMLHHIADEGSLSPPVVKFARTLLEELYRAVEPTDALIAGRASNWDIRRMAVIDRNILRIAVTELCFFKQVPVKVVIDEAVELAKAFGDKDSGKFVNGVIDSINKTVNTTTVASGKEGSLHGTDSCQK